MKKNLINLLLGTAIVLTIHLPSSAATLPDQEVQILKLVELALDDESGREFVRGFALSSGQRVDDEILRGLYAEKHEKHGVKTRGHKTRGQVLPFAQPCLHKTRGQVLPFAQPCLC